MDLETLALAKKCIKETMEGAGAIKGEKGDTGADGFSPTITENENNTEDTYKLDITNKDGTFTTPNLKGQGGSGDGSTGTTDHNDLTNRDMANQHPISAIEGLQEALDNVEVDLSDYATKEEVKNSITEIETNKQDKLTEEQLQNIEDVADKANSIDVYSKDVADTTFIKAAEKGQASGVATLNNMGVIPNDQINISSLNVKGTWDASTNTPALVNGVGTSGDFYITSVAGSVDFGAGEISFSVGDWALYTDSGVWEKSVNASAVQSVNGKTGLVNILDTDVLNEEQLKAVNSGIDEVKVQQIETNKTDIAETKTSLKELSMQVATNTGAIETKLDKTTDVANAGKGLIVGDDGAIGFSEAKGKVFGHVRELGLTTSATLAEITEAMPDGSILMLKVDVMDNPSEYLNIMTGTVTITRYGNGRIQAFMTEKLTGKTWTGIIDSTSNAITGWNEILTDKSLSIKTYNNPTQLGLSATCTTVELAQALRVIAANNDYSVMGIFNNGGSTITDAPTTYGLLHIECIAYDRILIRYEAITSSKYVDSYIGEIAATSGVFTDVKWTKVEGEILHTDLSGDLAGTTTTLDLINKMITEFRAKAKPVRFVSGNLTQANLTDLPTQYGVLDITVAGYDVVNVSFSSSSFGFKQMYYGYLNRTSSETLFSSISWGQVDTNTKSLVSNSATFTIDITKRNASWYCPIKFRYLYGTNVSELDLALTTSLSYSVSMGPNVVKSITYTVDGANIKIGIEFTTAMYGTQIVSMPSECATINSLTKDAFTGTETAELKLNYKTTYYDLSSMGLDSSATLNDVIGRLPVGGSATLNTLDFTNYQTIFPYEEEQDMYATVKVDKGYDHNGSRTIVMWIRKDASKVVYGGMGANNTVQWWNKLAIDSTPTVTTMTLPTNITGTVKYCIKNGICYVGIRDLKSSGTTTSITLTVPKALLTVSQQFGQLGGTSITNALYIEEGKTVLTISATTAPTSISFSYPVA